MVSNFVAHTTAGSTIATPTIEEQVPAGPIIEGQIPAEQTAEPVQSWRDRTLRKINWPSKKWPSRQPKSDPRLLTGLDLPEAVDEDLLIPMEPTCTLWQPLRKSSDSQDNKLGISSSKGEETRDLRQWLTVYAATPRAGEDDGTKHPKHDSVQYQISIGT